MLKRPSAPTLNDVSSASLEAKPVSVTRLPACVPHTSDTCAFAGSPSPCTVARVITAPCGGTIASVGVPGFCSDGEARRYGSAYATAVTAEPGVTRKLNPGLGK